MTYYNYTTLTVLAPAMYVFQQIHTLSGNWLTSSYLCTVINGYDLLASFTTLIYLYSVPIHFLCI